MNIAGIEDTILARLRNAEIEGLALVWPNLQTKLPVPRAVVQTSFGETFDATLDASAPFVPGFIMVTVVTEEGKGTTESLQFAAQIVALYPMGLRLTAPDGKIEIKRHPSILTGFSQGGAWRQPVKISFEAG